MNLSETTLLPDRGLVSVTGADAEKLLQGLLTNDVALLHTRPAIHAGLLSPQGKILAEFIVARAPGGGFLIDAHPDRVADLVKRLTMYRLRADVAIGDVSDTWCTGVAEGQITPGDSTVTFADPRHQALGWRILAPRSEAAMWRNEPGEATYHAARIAHGVPEGGRDYDWADAYPHEANFDLFGGVSFTKGCYVGQEIVARMEHKTSIRKRVVRVEGQAALPAGRPDIVAAGVPIGRLGSVDATHGLALIRLDRVGEFEAKGVPLTASGIELRIAETDRTHVDAAQKERAP